ncbi:MAG: type II secretion system protein [Phycisphaerae bacterium]|nr:type II secretion system protein [Phycisphaerae bacterium]MDD5381628.1 type II secretion system protein [Phycisphaerae bacterium]
MKDKKSAHRNGVCRSVAFTLVELLSVLGIIAILVALLIPALTMVRDMAKETQQKAQIATIEMALTAFKHDYGDYPPSHGTFGSSIDYYYPGAQTLAEALVGWDLLGFHFSNPKSSWDSVGTAYPQPPTEDDLKNNRRGPYLELATANAFRLNNLFTGISSNYNSDAFVICDVFGKKPVKVGGKTVMAGAPILYYKANTSSKTIDYTSPILRTELIYNYLDNRSFIYDFIPASPLYDTQFFYDYIRDPKVTTAVWPFRPESYLLISAGSDGLYGTRDDICNFDPNFPPE